MPFSRPRFASKFLAAAAAALLLGGNAMAQQATGASPFLGEWELDLTRMPETYGPPPKRVTFQFEDVGAGQWRTKVEITAPNDSVRRATVQYRRDGKAVKGEGDTLDGDTVAFTSPAPNVLMMSMAKNKGLVGVRVYAISADGREMTESAAGINRDGAPFARDFHFRRIR